MASTSTGRWSRRTLIGATSGAGALAPLALLAGCGASGGAPPAPAKQVSGTVQPLMRSNPAEIALWKEAFDLFQQRHPTIKVDPIDAGDNYDDKTQVLVASGTPPSLWFPGASTGFRHWANKKVVHNLDPLISRDRFDLKVFPERYLSYHKFDGHLMALPMAFYPFVLFYNKSLLDASGVRAPTRDWNDKTWTWDRYLETGRTLTKSEGGKVTQFGIGDVGHGAPYFSAMLFGGDWFPEDAYESGWIRKFTGTSQEVEDAYQYQQDLRYKHHVHPTAADTKEMGQSVSAAFAAGKIATRITDISYFDTLAKATGLQWGLAAIPIGAGKARRTLMWSDYWSIFSPQASLDAAWELLKFMVSPDGQRIYPMRRGPMSSLTSLAGEWIDAKQKQLGLAADDLKVATQGVDVEHLSADNFTINWPDLKAAIKDTVDKIIAGEVGAKAALEGVVPAAEAAIKKSLPS